MKYALAAAAAAFVPYVAAQGAAYAQCGGIGWSGATTCVSGYTCTKGNDYYSQCLPGSAPPAPAPQPTTRAGATTARPATTLRTTRTSAPAGGATSAPANPPAASGNPIAGSTFWANPYYASEVSTYAIPSLVAAGKPALASKAAGVAKVGSFVWMDTRAKVPSIEPYAVEVERLNAAGGKNILPIVVYNLPDRDCAALASAGELIIAQNGAALYRQYIDSIVAIIKKHPTVKFVTVYEPDSFANYVTNLGVPKCANAAPVHRELAVYAFKALDLPNVVLYADAGHAGWLGWPANLPAAAKEFANLYNLAGKPKAVRGLVTNVSNYNAYKISQCPAITTPNANCDESRYINALAPLLQAEGFPAKFLVDVGRNGRQPTGQDIWGNWCNVKGAGFGVAPTTNTGDPLVDALVWVKPGGEADGTSDSTAVRYDQNCGVNSAFKPAPEAGTWFQAYFEMLLENSASASYP